MNKRMISIVIFVSMLVFASTTTASTQENVMEINQEASRLTYKLDEQGMAHFVYLTGIDPIFEPSGEETLETMSQNMYYGTHDVANEVTTIELITNNDVFPYHYNFQIDSTGQIHTTYVSNYTLYYAVRSTAGEWVSEEINDKLNWYAYQPDIVLGANEEPRIVYVASYKDGATNYFGHQVSTAYRAVHYVLKNSTGWSLYDVSMNSGESSTKSPGRFLVYNPALMIDNGIVYVSYNLDSALASSSNIEFLRFSENPDIENSQGLFDEFKFPKIYEAAVRATKFRRPQIFTLDGDIVMLIGSWTAGGGIIAYLNDKSLSPIISDTASTSNQWEIFQIENNRRSLQIEAFTGSLDKEHGRIVGVYSTYHLYDEQNNKFNRDVMAMSFSPSDGEIGSVKYYRITDTANTHNTYASVNHLDEDKYEIDWLTWDMVSDTKLVRTTIDLSASSYDISDKTGFVETEERETDNGVIEDGGTETTLLFNSRVFYGGIIAVLWITRRKR